jgi:hypothetical protein
VSVISATQVFASLASGKARLAREVTHAADQNDVLQEAAVS